MTERNEVATGDLLPRQQGWSLAKRVDALEAALRGANWMIGKLKRYEALAYVHGIRCTPEEAAEGAKYREMIDAALADAPVASKGFYFFEKDDCRDPSDP